MLAFAGTLVAGLTYFALESDGVVLVETSDPTGAARTTHVWFVENRGKTYLEAGSPNNPWVQDLAGTQKILIAGGSKDGQYFFMLKDKPHHHELIRTLMRNKYGWRDWWISILFDTSQSALVELQLVPFPTS